MNYIEFFKDDNGRLSMTRLLSFLLVVGGLVYIFIYPDHYIAGVEVILLGLGGKLTQKQIEKRDNNNSGNGSNNNERV